MGTQHLSLKWNSHQKNMLDVFEQLLWNEDLVDVTLACEGTTLKAHKTVLSACSTFFHNLLSQYPDKHPIIIMKDMKFSDLKIIVDFMYRGEVIVAHDQLSELLKTADTLKIKGLSESVTDGSYRSEVSKEQEASSHSFNTSLVPTASHTPTSEQTLCQSSSSAQKRRKRIRQRKRSSSISSDDQTSSNKLTAETDYIEIIEDDTTLKSNNASSDISQSEPSTFDNNVNVQNACDIVQPGSSQDSSVNADVPLHSIDAVRNSKILDHQTSDKNLRIAPEAEFIIPTVSLTEIVPMPLVPPHSSPCSVSSEISAATHILQEGNNKDIKPVSLMSFEDQPLTFEGGLSCHESSLTASSVKIEETPSPNPCVPIIQQPEQRSLQDICATTSGYSRITDYSSVREKIVPIEKKSQLPNLEHINLLVAEKVLNDHSARKCKTKVQQHVCNICSKSFSQRSYLATHHRTHTGERPFSCDQCGKRYRQAAHLYTHKVIHSGEKPFTCNQCGKKFTRLRHLRMHLMIHSRKMHFS